MNMLKKAAVSVAIAAACSGAMAATVPAGSFAVYDGMAPVTVNTSTMFGDTYDPIFYELNVSDSNGSLASFSLIDTNPDKPAGTNYVQYTLFNDTNASLNLIDVGTQLVQQTIWDNNNAFASEGYFSYFFATPGQYVLKMVTNMAAPSASTSVVSAVPLPAAAWLFGSAVLGMLGFARRRKQDVAAV